MRESVTGREAPTEVRGSPQPWTLIERWGDYQRGWWLMFENGDDRLEVEVPEGVWRAFGV